MNDSMLPHDLRSQVESRDRGHRGIGGAARENAAQAEARQRALGEAPRAPAGSEPAPENKPEPADPKEEICTGCKQRSEAAWRHCPKCGRDLLAERDPVKWLGIAAFTNDDVQDYLFRGYIVRDLPLLGSHKLRMKSAQPKDMKDVDAFFMNGEYKDKALSGELYKQLHAMATIATSIFSLDDQSIGKDLKEKMAWLEERGSALVDMITHRVAVFNRTWTRYLEDQNRLLGF